MSSATSPESRIEGAFKRFAYYRSLALLMPVALLGWTVGCGPSKQTEISGKENVFSVEGDKQSGAERNGTATRTESGRLSGGIASSEAAQSPSIALQDSRPGADTRSFMTITKPTKTDAKGWVKFLADNDKALGDLMNGARNGMVAEKLYMERATALSKMKLEASESLKSVASDQIEKDAATLGILEALSHLAGLQDVAAAEKLRQYASQIASIKDPKAAHQARLVLLGFCIGDLDSGQTNDPKAIVNQLASILSDKSELDLVDFSMASEALTVLSKQGFGEQAEASRKRICEAFINNTDPKIANTAWQMSVVQSKEFEKLQQTLSAMLDDPGKSVDLPTFKKVLEDFMNVSPSQFALAFLAGQLMVPVEYSGFLDHAHVIAEAIQSRMKIVDNPDLKDELARTVDSFTKRLAIVGKPIELSGLVSLNGLHFDWPQFRGKVVLVDFWATWCGPCKEEFPNMTAVYEKYRNQGFEIVGVNLDDTPDVVDQFFQRQPLAWATVRSSDPKQVAFNTPLVKQLGIVSIPFLFLVDKQGKVARLHARGPKLEVQVRELLGLPPS